MPKASMVAAAAQKCRYNPNVRIVRGFNSLAGSQNRLGGLAGRRRRSYASGDATSCPGQRRVERWRGPGFDDADVSIAPPKIPYGGFSPVRLQGQPVRQGLPPQRSG